MKIYYHGDMDGKCAAALVYQEFGYFENMTESDFIRYCHKGTIIAPQVTKGEKVYIVDLSCDEVIGNCVREMLLAGAEIVHIDHHISGIKYAEEFKKTLEPELLKHYTTFFENEVSGAMLTCIYTWMSETERSNPDAVDFSFDNMRKTLFLGNEKRRIAVPLTVRLIDDNDLWLHKDPASAKFQAGSRILKASDKFIRKIVELRNPKEPTEDLKEWNKKIDELMSEQDINEMKCQFATHPMSDVWEDILKNNVSRVATIVNDGTVIQEYEKTSSASRLNYSFERMFNGAKVICLNEGLGNSSIFLDKYNEYDAVCKYNYDGNLFTYTFYSKTDGASCLDIVKSLEAEYPAETKSAGGHIHAAGITATLDFVNSAKYRISE